MTIWYDFTTTLLADHRNGIASVEWNIGMALRDVHQDVRFFARRGRHLVEIDPDSDFGAAFYASDDVPPRGVSIAAPTWRDRLRAALRAALGPRSTPVIRTLSAVYQLPRRLKRRVAAGENSAAPGSTRLADLLKATDVIVSMGADWEGGLARDFGDLRRRSGCSVVTMVFDLIPLTHTHLAFHKDPALFARYYESLLSTSNLITCISEQSRQDLLTFASERGLDSPPTAVLRLGEPEVSPVADVERGDFFLWVSTLERRKNLELLYDALRILESEGASLPRIAVVGARGWGVEDLLLELSYQSTAASRSITLLGPVDDETLAGLYARARALLYPSLYEGWGLPVREAAVRGCPVAAGDSPAVRAAVEGYEGATLLPVYDPQPWADYLRREPLPAVPAPAHTWADTARSLAAHVTTIGRSGSR